jgi:hypothetical protein
MANQKHLKVITQGVEDWNKWRRKKSRIIPDLSGAKLRGAKLDKADLTSVNLRAANLDKATLTAADLRGANLDKTSLIEANLSAANLSKTSLIQADLYRANLIGADLNRSDLARASLLEAHLIGANLMEANLTQADLTNSYLGSTRFGDTDLGQVKGLETVRHTGPSTIGIDTIYRSNGDIPEMFLRGAGVPDVFIANMKSLVAAMAPIEFYSCFISYSTKDQEFATRLHADLQSKGVRCWFAPHDVKSGRKLHEQIDHAIRVHERLLLILSPSSMNSEWVKTEIAKARKREIEEKKQVLFPIRLVDFDVIKKWECFDADTGKDSAREIREYFIPNFSNWTNPASYERALERLLKDLRGEETKGVGAQ